MKVSYAATRILAIINILEYLEGGSNFTKPRRQGSTLLVAPRTPNGTSHYGQRNRWWSRAEERRKLCICAGIPADRRTDRRTDGRTNRRTSFLDFLDGVVVRVCSSFWYHCFSLSPTLWLVLCVGIPELSEETEQKGALSAWVCVSVCVCVCVSVWCVLAECVSSFGCPWCRSIWSQAKDIF